LVYDARELQRSGAQKRRPRAPRSWDRAVVGAEIARLHIPGPCIPLRGRIFLRKTLLCPTRSHATGRDEVLRTMCFARLLAKGAPECCPKAARSGDRAAVDAERDYISLGRSHSATGSHLPSEGTAPPFAVAFASSPFAHPIPQSRRRAHMGFIQKFLAASTIVETRGKSAGSPRRIDFAIFFPVGCQ
jgi:hypothetical protein